MQDIIFITKEGKIISNASDPLCLKLIGFEAGSKIYTKKSYFSLGGGASNIAVGLRRLGLKTGLIARLGQDVLGQTIVKELKKEKINTSYLQKDSHLPTGLSFIVSLPKSSEQVIFSSRGANNNLEIPKKKILTQWFAVSSLSFSNWVPILNYLISQNKKILWNPGIAQIRVPFSLLSKYLAKITILVVNEDEAREIIFQKSKKEKISLKSVIKQIYYYGPKIVVVTRGEKGAIVFDGQTFYSQPAKKTRVVNVTGAGDAFISGFLAYFIKYSSVKKALQGGIMNSAAVISKIGAQRGLMKSKN